MNSTAVLRRFFIGALLVVFAFAAFGQQGVKKRRPLPQEFGNVVMNNFAEKSGEAPVVFSHWLHRSRFTCRLCHESSYS